MKTLERLRQLKKKAVDRMAELDGLATKEKRELTPAEKLEYDTQKATATDLTASIAELEQELAAQAPPAASAPPAPAPQPDTAALHAAGADAERSRIGTIRDRLTAARLSVDVSVALEKELVDGKVTVDLASAKIFEAMAKKSADEADTRPGLGAGRGDAIAQVQNLAREVAQRDGLSKERATVQVLNANPKLYDQYLQANPAQTGARQ